jgi:glycosyltransferase involved in cell wall biosynthesis
MYIVFWGQLGLTKLLEKDLPSSEQRVETLGTYMANKGNDVVVLATKAYENTPKNQSIIVTPLPSSSKSTGGWLYVFLGLVYILRHRPQIVHIHGWQTAMLASLTKPLFRSTTMVWTIDSLPKHVWLYGKIAPLMAKSFDIITVPTRTMQYRLLTQFSLRAQYIPDGYVPSKLADASLTAFKLRREQYAVALVNSPESLRTVAEAYAKTNSRKKLVVSKYGTGSYARLARQFPFLRFIGEISGRSWQSVVNNAAVVVLGDATTSSSTLLKTMNSARNIVAINEPSYQELLSVTGQYYHPTDINGLVDILTKALKKDNTHNWGEKAHKRAFAHFRWERILSEYLNVYCIDCKKVSMDSLRPVLFTKHANA